MQGRTTEDYIEIFNKICNIANVQIQPSTAIADFEIAERNALEIAFPGIKVIGCFFHYSQALVHNAKKHKILKGEKKELGYGAVKLLISLALLPEVLIEEGFDIISKVIFKICKYVEAFFNYYTDTWLKGFKPESFCVYKQLYKTNNISERHNRELKETLKHSTIVAFLTNLTDHQRTIHSMLNHPTFWARPQCNIFKKKKANLKEIWNKLENNEEIDLLVILHELSELVGKEINL